LSLTLRRPSGVVQLNLTRALLYELRDQLCEDGGVGLLAVHWPAGAGTCRASNSTRALPVTTFHAFSSCTNASVASAVLDVQGVDNSLSLSLPVGQLPQTAEQREGLGLRLQFMNAGWCTHYRIEKYTATCGVLGNPLLSRTAEVRGLADTHTPTPYPL
jgi:hypothetical protein